jgi:hypothetical protein
MTALKRAFLQPGWVLAIGFAVTLLLVPQPASAQSQGTYVDECSSEVVDQQFSQEITVCLFGSVADDLNAYVDVGPGDGDNYVAGLGAGMDIYNDTTSFNFYDPGAQYESQNPPGDVQVSYSFPPTVDDTYTVWGNAYECIDYSGEGNIYNCSWDEVGTSQATAEVTAYNLEFGYLNPKYLIMGVTYAPPGGNSSSYVSYQNTDFVGNTSMDSESFSQGYSESISIGGTTGSVAVGGGLFGFSGGVQVTGTQSNAWTIESNSTNTVTINKQTSTTLKTPGVPNVYSPVDHDYDIIWVWVNPVVLYSVPSNNCNCSGGTGSIIWNGYGYDYNDPNHDIDVWPVYVGYLNGDFGPLDTGTANVFSRSWVTTQNFASGQGPGITSADYSNILGADPFAYNPYDLNSGYILNLESNTSPPTTADGRFTLSEFENQTPQTIPYEQAPPDSTQGEQETYQDQYSNSNAVGQGGSYQYEVGFGMEEKVGGTFFGQGVQYDFKQNWSYTWKNTWQNTVTNTSTQTDTAQITGPPCPASTGPCDPLYSEPTDINVYQDNLYGTFMFWPNPYFVIGTTGSSAPNTTALLTPSLQTISAGSSATFSIPTSANAGYSGTLTSFSVTGLPSGATASFSPTSGAAGTTFTMTIATQALTSAGTYPISISGTDGSLTYIAYATLVINASPGFAISVGPGTETIGVSGSATYTVTTAATNGFNGVVSLNVTGLPSNVSANFSPQTVTGSGSSTLTIATTANTAPGTYQLTFTGTSGSLTQSTNATLVVTGASFTLTVTPEIQSINAGEDATYTVTTTGMSGFSGTVALSLPGLPSGVSATFSPSSITGSGSSTLTVTTSTSTAAADYQLSVNGVSGNLTETGPLDLEVNQ